MKMKSGLLWASAMYPEEELRRARVAAAIFGITRSELLRRALEEYLERHAAVLDEVYDVFDEET